MNVELPVNYGPESMNLNCDFFMIVGLHKNASNLLQYSDSVVLCYELAPVNGITVQKHRVPFLS